MSNEIPLNELVPAYQAVGFTKARALRLIIQSRLMRGQNRGKGNKASRREAMLGFGKWLDERREAWLESPDFALDLDRMAEIDSLIHL